MLSHDEFFIGGRFAKSHGDDYVHVISPSSEETIGRFPAAVEADVDDAVAAARQAFDEGPWPTMPLEERIAIVAQLRPLLVSRLD
ncbi:MAG: aldehyde dehydrogenase family protein, partial [Polyangiaceae bacterium]